MKIYYIITRADDLGGAQTHVLELATAIAARGDEVLVLAGGNGILDKALAERGVPCLRIDRLVRPIKPLYDLAAFWELRGFLKSGCPDLVTTHSNKAGFLGRLAARSLNIAVVHTSHGWLFDGRSPTLRDRFYMLLEKMAARSAGTVITVSQFERDLAEKLALMHPEKMVTIHNGLPDVVDSMVAKPGEGMSRLVTVARFAEPKDNLTVLRALSGLKRLPWRLQMVGDGELLSRAKALAEDLGLKNRVDFLGMRLDTPKILATSSVFVLSSRREGFPISILEAMRAGLPVVASDVGGVSEAVQEGVTGYLFPQGDSVILSERLALLLQNPALRCNMGIAARRRYLELFTQESMVEKTVDVYRKLLNNKDNYRKNDL